MRARTTMRSSRMPSLARQMSTWKAYLESWEGIDSGSESTFAQNRCKILPKITSTAKTQTLRTHVRLSSRRALRSCLACTRSVWVSE